MKRTYQIELRHRDKTVTVDTMEEVVEIIEGLESGEPAEVTAWNEFQYGDDL